MKTMMLVLIASAAMLLAPAAHANPPAPDREALIAHEMFTLPNGLRVVVHEDHSAPKVAVAVWYHVGSMNEPQGQTGFAHLFEHLMFNGSENHDDEYMPPLQEIGASAVNGATTLDQTYYYAVVPTGGLERVLWLESDRMGHLLGAVTQAKLDEQRGVVQNEKRTRDNQPYSMMPELRAEAIFPSDHPYHHPIIGSMEDLDAASLEAVHAWFHQYYGAANAVVAIAGDVTVERARELMTRYFSAVQPGPPIGRMTEWTPLLEHPRSEVVADNVPQTAIAWSWPVPGQRSEDKHALRMASAILGRGRLSRLHRALVVDRRLANSVSANYEGWAVAGAFTIDVRLQPGADRAEVEAVVQEVMADFLAEGPTDEELERARIGAYGDTVRMLDSLYLRAMMLAGGTISNNDPAQFQIDQEAFEAVRADQVISAANRWLARPNYRLTVLPEPQFAASQDLADRSALPPMGPAPELNLPPVREAVLSNGLRVVHVEREGSPTVDMVMSFTGGGAVDQGLKPGLQSFALGLMDDGTGDMTGEAFARSQEMLGARIHAYSDSDTTNFALSALTRSLDDTVALWARYVREPSFPEAELERERALALSGVQRALADPVSIAGRVFNNLIYGDVHAYGSPLAGRAEAIESITRDDLVDFHQAFIRPDNAVIFAAGDAEFTALVALLEAHLGDWQAPSVPLGRVTVEPMTAQTAPRIVLVDRPGSVQSVIRAGHIAPEGLDPRVFDLGVVNGVLGGGFTSRLNMNLRENKGWTYGAGSYVSEAIGPQAFVISTSVQTDRTADALAEIVRELQDIRGPRPTTPEELELYRRGQVLTLSDRFETNNAMVGYLRHVARFERPYEWITTLPERYGALTPETVTEAAALVNPDAMTWVIVGDLSRIESEIRALDLGVVEVWDAQGAVLR